MQAGLQVQRRDVHAHKHHGRPVRQRAHLQERQERVEDVVEVAAGGQPRGRAQDAVGGRGQPDAVQPPGGGLGTAVAEAPEEGAHADEDEEEVDAGQQQEQLPHHRQALHQREQHHPQRLGAVHEAQGAERAAEADEAQEGGLGQQLGQDGCEDHGGVQAVPGVAPVAEQAVRHDLQDELRGEDRDEHQVRDLRGAQHRVTGGQGFF